MQSGSVKPLLAYTEDLIGVVAGMSRVVNDRGWKSATIVFRR